MKVYIDTNILVDFICRRDTFFEPAKALFATGYPVYTVEEILKVCDNI